MSEDKAARRRWTESELLLALHLYVRTPFGRQDSRNPEIVDLARRLGRTPGSVSMKLNNLASLDPVEQARGIRGLPGASNADRRVFERYLHDTEATLLACEAAWDGLEPPSHSAPGDSLTRRSSATRPEGRDTERLARQRQGQGIFRMSLDSLYSRRCAVTGIDLRPLLRASHIKPWSACSGAEKLDPRNGILLSASYDAAFDAGLITLSTDLVWTLSSEAKRSQSAENQHFFSVVADKQLRAPEGREPRADYVEYHRNNVFLG